MTLLIGDIHGCYAELLDLIAAAGIGDHDDILAVGDLLDRGPEGPQVFEFFHSRPLTFSIMGNHERKHLRSARGELSPAPSQRITKKQLGDRYADWLAFVATLPRHCEFPDALVVHGFWEPGVPLAQQRDNVVIGAMSGEKYLEKRYGSPWYQHYDGPKKLIVGHHDYCRNGQPLVFQDRVYGIDTGCVYGGRLTGLLLPEWRFVSVPARADHWAATRREYPEIFPTGRGE
jgi:serine/threonine protein phosphatase 1